LRAAGGRPLGDTLMSLVPDLHMLFNLISPC
jgi:hypothetical protein